MEAGVAGDRRGSGGGGLHGTIQERRQLIDSEGATLVPHNSPHRIAPTQLKSVANCDNVPRNLNKDTSPKSLGAYSGVERLTVDTRVHAQNDSSDRENVNSSEEHDMPSPAKDAMMELDLHERILQTNPLTSTPIASTSTGIGYQTRPERPHSLPANTSLSVVLPTSDPSETESELTASNSSLLSTQSTQSQTDVNVYENQVAVPIVGYEIMEERARFTVYKIQVQKSKEENWFIFRRYNDFLRLNERLKELFPHFRLSLPPKKWFGDNFDKEFLDDRLHGLQAFLNNIVGHRDVANSEPLRDFFCFGDPPGPHDSLEESRATCEAYESQIYTMKTELKEKTARITLLEEELALQRAEIDNLRKSLRLERALNASRHRERASPSTQSQKSECSLPEQDQRSCPEVDQQPTSNPTTSLTLTSPGDSSTLSLDAISESTTKDLKVHKVKSVDNCSKTTEPTLLPS